MGERQFRILMAYYGHEFFGMEDDEYEVVGNLVIERDHGETEE